MKRTILFLLLAGVLGSASAEVATSDKHAKTATTYRQSVFQLLRSNMAPLGGMAKGVLPYDAEVMQTNALRMQQLAEMLPDYLQTDTRKFDVDTDAKPQLWDNFADVEKKAEALKAAAMKLEQVAKAMDESAYRAAIGDVGASCKSCHDEYKAD